MKHVVAVLAALFMCLASTVECKTIKVEFQDGETGRDDVETKDGDTLEILYPDSQVELKRVANVFVEDPCIPSIMGRAIPVGNDGFYKEKLQYGDNEQNLVFYLELEDENERIVCFNYRKHVEILPKKGQPTRAPTMFDVDQATLSPTTRNESIPEFIPSLPARRNGDGTLVAAVVASIGFGTLLLAVVVRMERKSYDKKYAELLKRYEEAQKSRSSSSSSSLTRSQSNMEEGGRHRSQQLELPNRGLLVRASDSFFGTRRPLIGLTKQEGGTGKMLTEDQRQDLVQFVADRDANVQDPKAHVAKLMSRYSQANLKRALKKKYNALPPTMEELP